MGLIGSFVMPLQKTLFGSPICIAIYLSIRPNESRASERSAIEACLADVGGLMNTNILKLNQEKANSLCFRPNTEFVG